MVHRPHPQRPPDVVNTIELVGHLPERLGADHPDGIGEFVTQFGMGAGRIRREPGADARHPRIVLGPGADLAGEDDCGGWCAADHRCVRAGHRGGLHVIVEPLGEHDEGAAVITGHDDQDDRATEIGYRPADLGAIFQLPGAHALR